MSALLREQRIDGARPCDWPTPSDADAANPITAPRQTLHPQFMLVPSLTCPAECSYCFGPHNGPIMSAETLEMALDFMAQIVAESGQRDVKTTLHGGEPLSAGPAILRQALEGMATRFCGRQQEVAIQSNLWLLDDELCRLFRRYHVGVGTSLDGPEHLTDRQRGRGYFARTMAGIRRAQRHGIGVGCIATFTPLTLPHWREVFDFFLHERLGFSIHAALPPLEERAAPMALSPREYGTLLQQVLDYYVAHRRELAVQSLDQICQGLGCGKGRVCIFRDCLGMFLAIDPNGDIFACQRFCGRPQDRLGKLSAKPRLKQLFSSPTAQRFLSRQRAVQEACKECAHLRYCKGGCPYNAWANGNEHIKDPYCAAYAEVFAHIQHRLAAEMASEENINAIVARRYNGNGHPLLRQGALIELVRDGPHPSRIARTAKRIIGAVELAKGPDIPAAAVRLVKLGVCRNQQSAEASLNNLWRQLHPATVRLNNLCVRVTSGCRLECANCHMRAGAMEFNSGTMRVAALEKLVREAKDAGFRRLIITGGEPPTPPQRDEMLRMLADARRWTRPMNLVLHTVFAVSLGIHSTRFHPLLPLSRPENRDEPPTSKTRGAYVDPMELIENGFHPAASCSPGENLCVEPSGEAFLCNANHQSHSLLGNVFDNGLFVVLRTERFQRFPRQDVDSNPKCRTCHFRYLCGGAYRPLGGEACLHGLDMLPAECEALRDHSLNLYVRACEFLKVCQNRKIGEISQTSTMRN